MCETVDAEVKTEALALTELNEAAAVTQMKLSDVSFKGEGKRRVCAAFEADVRGEQQIGQACAQEVAAGNGGPWRQQPGTCVVHALDGMTREVRAERGQRRDGRACRQDDGCGDGGGGAGKGCGGQHGRRRSTVGSVRRVRRAGRELCAGTRCGAVET